MTNLYNAFSFLEKRLSLIVKRWNWLIFENNTHKLDIELLNNACTISISITLKKLPNSSIDAYSLISFFDKKSLEKLINSKDILTTSSIIDFLASELAGPCSPILDITETSDWMKLHQFHLKSVHNRNEAFWKRLSGINLGNEYGLIYTY